MVISELKISAQDTQKNSVSTLTLKECYFAESRGRQAKEQTENLIMGNAELQVK